MSNCIFQLMLTFDDGLTKTQCKHIWVEGNGCDVLGCFETTHGTNLKVQT